MFSKEDEDRERDEFHSNFGSANNWVKWLRMKKEMVYQFLDSNGYARSVHDLLENVICYKFTVSHTTKILNRVLLDGILFSFD